jgi:hypothetical protein
VGFVNRLTQLNNLGGVPYQNDSLFLKQNTALSGTAQQTTSLTGLTPTISKGYVRVKVYDGGGTSPTLLNLIVNFTDGTTYVNVAFFAPVVAIAPALSVTPGGTQLATNGSITSGAAILTSTSAPFTPSQVGQAIAVSGAGTGGAVLYSTVLSYQSSTQVTLANNAGTTVTTSATITLTSSYGNGGSNTSLGGIDFLIPFEIDLSATQCSVLTTLGGTSPTATIDIEVAATS